VALLLGTSKEILKLAIPISIFNLTTVLITIVNGLFLARLGTNELAAGALIGITQLTFTMIFSAPLFSISSIISRLNGENKYIQMGNVMRQGILFSMLLSVPAIVGILVTKTILSGIGQPTHIIELVSRYFKAYVWCMPASMLLTCSQQFLLGLKKTRLITYIGVISFIISVTLSYILTFGKMGFPSLGIAGLGYAQSARIILMLLFIVMVIASTKEFKIFKLLPQKPFSEFIELKKLFKLGWPISIHAASECLVLFILTLIAGKMGAMALIAQQISTQYIQFLSILFLACSQSASLMVSQSIGQNDWKAMERYSISSIFIGVCIGSIAVLAFVFFSNELISPYIIFNENSHLKEVFKKFFIITMIGQIFASGKTISIGILRGLYDTKSPMIIAATCGWLVTIPLAFILTHIMKLGISGLAIAQAVGTGLCLILLSEKRRTLIRNFNNPQKSVNTSFPALWNLIYHLLMRTLKIRRT